MKERPRELRDLVRWPGALLVTAGVLQLASIAGSTVLVETVFPDFMSALESLSPVGAAGGGALGVWNAISTALSVVLSLVVLAGGLQMMRGRSWGLSLTAAVLAMVPCFAPCCGLFTPAGIWAILVLNRPDVREGMKR